MTNEELYKKFKEEIDSKRDSLDIELCPWPKEEIDAYKEGWRAAFSWADDILARLLTQ